MAMRKRAEILQENVVFIVLNVAFFSILILFIYSQGSSVHLKEEETAKQIALLIDASKPRTHMEINIADFLKKLDKNGISKEKSIEIDNIKNLVIVRWSKDSFYEYSYFNDVDVEYNFKENYLILVVK